MREDAMSRAIGSLVNSRSTWRLLVGTLLVVVGFLAGWGVAVAQSSKTGWLLQLGPEARMEAIQRQFRGFETTMTEVAYRYNEMYLGGMEGNWGYAEHMVTEMQKAFATGLERSPQRRANAETLFLRGPLLQAVEAVRLRDVILFKQRMEALRAACTNCHAAEGKPFLKVSVPQIKRNPIVND
jgi:hypothetical protein